LHRCLQRHGISRLPNVTGDKPDKRKFKAYPIGSFHIDIAEVHREEGRVYLFVAMDRTSKFAFAQLHERATRHVAADFLRAVIAVVPYKIHTVLTDSGTQFVYSLPIDKQAETEASWATRGEPRIYRVHAFAHACEQNGIEPRLTKPRHPWTTDVIDKSFFCVNWCILVSRTGDSVAKSRT
jgi:hypothetical protein